MPETIYEEIIAKIDELTGEIPADEYEEVLKEVAGEVDTRLSLIEEERGT